MPANTESDEDAIAYFNAMAETGDSTLLQASLDDISKARGVIQIAAGEAGVGRETELGRKNRWRYVRIVI